MLDVPQTIKQDDGTITGRVSLALTDEQTILKNIMADYIQEILLELRNGYKAKGLNRLILIYKHRWIN